MKTNLKYTAFALVFVIIITGTSLANTTHFIPPPGNPFQPMTIFIIGASFDGMIITNNFEIGAFDGGLCVGAAAFTTVVSQGNPLELIATKDDGTANGFTDGNPIIFKLWDATIQQEYTLTNGSIQFYDPGNGEPISPVNFSALGI